MTRIYEGQKCIINKKGILDVGEKYINKICIVEKLHTDYREYVYVRFLDKSIPYLHTCNGFFNEKVGRILWNNYLKPINNIELFDDKEYEDMLV